MTEKLKSLMHERAAAPDFEPPDVDVLMRAGTERVRRRRGLTVVAGVVAAAVVGGTAVLATDDPDGQSATEPVAPAALSWATGSVVHTLGGDLDVGHPVEAYVRTAEGYVVADERGRVWSVVGSSVAEVGRTDPRRLRLVGDSDGSRAGWVEPRRSGRVYAVVDQATGDVTRFGHDASRLFAIDGGTAYVRDPRGALAVDVDSGATRVIEAEVQDGDTVLAVEDGILAFDAVDDGTSVGTRWDDAVALPDSYGSQAAFSPDARWISVDADELRVYDVRTGDRVDLDVSGRYFATGYEWLDDHTLAVLSAEDEDDAADLLTCDVLAGTCQVAVADLGTFEELRSGFALPVGTRAD